MHMIVHVQTQTFICLVTEVFFMQDETEKPDLENVYLK